MENKYMKKKDIIIIIFFLMITGIGLLFFNKTEADRIPCEGIYFLKQNSFYAMNPMEKPTITLDWCEVLSNIDSLSHTDRIGECRLIDDIGEEYTVIINKDKLINENRTIELGNGFVAKKFRADIKVDIKKDVRIVAIEYTDEKSKCVMQNIGCIQLHFSDDMSGKMDFFSNRIDWEANIQPTFSHTELYISNEETEDVTINSISYGKNGIEIKGSEIFMVKAGESKLFDIEIELDENKGEPVIYYLKPCIRYKCNDKEIEIVSDNVSRESYYGTSNEMREYLYLISKQRKKI